MKQTFAVIEIYDGEVTNVWVYSDKDSAFQKMDEVIDGWENATIHPDLDGAWYKDNEVDSWGSVVVKRVKED